MDHTFIHLTPEGPRRCSTTPEACPKKTRHFTDWEEAHEAYGETMEARLFQGATKLRATEVLITPEALKGGSYFGAPVPLVATRPHELRLQRLLGEECFTQARAQKALRDGTLQGHVTILTPQDVRALKRRGVTPELPGSTSLSLVGVGTASVGERQAWFVICEAPAIQEWRGSLGLPPHDLHSTLGFLGGDVHGVPKGRGTLIP